MKRKRQIPTVSIAERLAILGVLMLGVLIVVAAWRAPHRLDRCPIDGHVADWTKQIDANSCEYGHFSAVERTFHTWSAACP
jgi:hypothetical protein